jgi:hypothetical protein
MLIRQNCHGAALPVSPPSSIAAATFEGAS